MGEPTESQLQLASPNINGSTGKAIEGKDPVNGRFIKGNKLGSGGSSFAGQMLKFRAEVMKSVQLKDLRAVTQTVVDKAIGGDMRACQLLYEITGVKVKHIEAKIEGGNETKFYVGVDVDVV